jgi:1,2-diacylglycerol-3-alpha-glucose alpha-1,2-galactosyltransferase
MKIHIVYESKHFKGNGVYTAFVSHIELMQGIDNVEVVLNNDVHGDILHSHTWSPLFFMKGLRYKGRRIHTVHVIPESIIGSLPMSHFFMPLVKWYFRKVYSFADVCIAISPHVEEAIRESGAKTEIVRISNPISTEKWKSSPEERKKGRAMLGIGEAEFVVLGVGQLQGRKGVEDFIEIARNTPEAKFIWVGGRPLKAMTEGIARIDKQMDHAPSNLSFTGMIDLELMPLAYNAADMMLFLSYQENCPLAPIEAAASGLPVVFRDLPEYKTLYEHAYIKGSSNEEFTDLVKRLMKDPLFFADAVTISNNLIRQFDMDTIREKLLLLYKQLYERHMNHSNDKPLKA